MSKRLKDEFADHDILGPPLRESWEQGFREGFTQGVREGFRDGFIEGQEQERRRFLAKLLANRYGALEEDILPRLNKATLPELENLFLDFLDGAALKKMFP